MKVGLRVRIVSWSPNFNGMRGIVTGSLGERPLVQLDGDVGSTLFWAGEVIPVDLDEPTLPGLE